MVTFLNMLPSKNGISNDLIPAAIILGSPKPDCNKLRIMFGEYSQKHIGTKTSTNYTTVVSIVLLSANEWGGYYLMSLDTGIKIHS